MDRLAKYPRLATMVASLLVIGALYLAKAVLIPFALAMLMSFLLAPLVLRLQRWHFTRVMAVVTAVLLVFVASSAATWVALEQVRDVTTKLTEYTQNLKAKLVTVHEAVSVPVQSATDLVAGLGNEFAATSAPEAAPNPIQTVRIAEPIRGGFALLSDALGSAVEILLTVAMALLFAFVMLLHRNDLGDRLIRMVGNNRILVTTRALEEASNKVSSYLWRLTLLNGLHGFAIWLGLTWIGVPHALLWGLLGTVLRFIPYVGPWITAACPVLIALAAAPGWSQPLLTIGWLAVLELVSNNLLEPWIYGKGTGLSPLAILVSSLFWTWLWGPLGLLLATPLTVCLVVMGKYVPRLQFLHLLFGDAPGLTPPERLYQRLIAGDQDQAWLELQAALRQQPLHDVYDAMLLPVLSMAEHDRQCDALEPEIGARIEETLKLLIAEAGELQSVPDANAAASRDADAAPAVPRPDGRRILCVAAHGSADALAAAMLGQVLERDGMHVEIAATAGLTNETLNLLETRQVDLVCISAVPPSRFLHVRYLCKRIAQRFPELPLVAGMWTLELGTQGLDERVALPASVHPVASLSAARTEVRRLAESSCDRSPRD
jgi:predicted PurR-regulated permease PerM